MINVSTEFKDLMSSRTDFKENAEITLTDGTVLILDESDFSVANNSFTDAAGADTLPLGVAISRSIQVELMNDDDHLSGYDFFGAKIRLYLTFRLSETVEKIELGTFTVVTPETYGETVIITANDDMYKADKPFETYLAFPATAQALLRDVCGACGISLYSTQFPNDTFTIQSAPSNALTFRQVIGYISMIAGGNARIRRTGGLEIKPYSFDFSGDSVHSLTSWKTLKSDVNDITITGVQTTREVETVDENGITTVETEPILNGSDGYVLSVENPLTGGSEEDLLAYLANILVGKSFRRFEGDYIAYPLAEFMDLAKITDRKGNSFNSIITDVNFVFFSFTTLKNSAESAIRAAGTYEAPANKAIIAARKLVERESAARELAVQQLNTRLETSSGMYPTHDVQPDGSIILYLHNKPTLSESQTVFKVADGAIGLSTDGGQTYPYGVTVDGDSIMRIIQAEGINAEWVKVENKTITEVIESTLSDAKEYSDQGLADYANAVSSSLDNIQAQIDGQVETYYLDYEPTLENAPASEWTTEEERIRHEGDLFFWKSTGYAYRFFKNGDTWEWTLVQDTNITKALAAASAAQTTANAKRRVFVATPTPPYDVGDLWTDGTDIKTCTTARTTGSQYVAADWEVLNDYANNDTVDALTQKTTTLETKLEVVDGKITSKVWQSDIETAVEGIQVGGRNLIRHSQSLSGGDASVRNMSLILPSDTFLGCSIAQTMSAWDGIYVNLQSIIEREGLQIGDTLTYSIYFKTNFIPEKNVSFTLFRAAATGIMVASIPAAEISPDIWYRLDVTFPVTEYALTSKTMRLETNYYIDSNYTFGAGNYMYFAAPKLERGNRATDYTPAPEDTEASVTTLKDQYSTLEQTVGGITTRVGDVETTATALGKRLSTAESTIQQQADQIALKVGQTELDDAVDSIQIGGTNLLPDTNVNTLSAVAGQATRYWSDATRTDVTCEFFELEDSPVKGLNYGVRHSCTATGNYGRNLTWRAAEKIELIDGETYTLSCYARVTSGTKARLRFRFYNSGSQVYYVIIDNTEWERISQTITVNKSKLGDDYCNIGCGGLMATYVATVELCGFKLERGTKATDWTPAPEDTEASISSVEAKLCLGVDSDGTAYLTGAAQRMHFEAEQLTIDSDNFQLDATGNVTAANATLYGSIYLDNGLWLKKDPRDAETIGDYIKVLYAEYETESTVIHSDMSFKVHGSLTAYQELLLGDISDSSYFYASRNGNNGGGSIEMKASKIGIDGPLAVTGTITSGGSKVLTASDIGGSVLSSLGGIIKPYYVTNDKNTKVTMTLSGLISSDYNESFHLLIFGRYFSGVMRVTIGQSSFDLLDYIGWSGTTPTFTANGRTSITFTDRAWSSYVIVLISPWFTNISLNISKSS